MKLVHSLKNVFLLFSLIRQDRGNNVAQIFQLAVQGVFSLLSYGEGLWPLCQINPD